MNGKPGHRKHGKTVNRGVIMLRPMYVRIGGILVFIRDLCTLALSSSSGVKSWRCQKLAVSKAGGVKSWRCQKRTQAVIYKHKLLHSARFPNLANKI